MPVQTDGIALFSEDYPSTWPLNKAYKAAELQDAGLARKFLRRMMEAVFAEAVPLNGLEKLVILAGETGLNLEQFVEYMAAAASTSFLQGFANNESIRGAALSKLFNSIRGKKDRSQGCPAFLEF